MDTEIVVGIDCALEKHQYHISDSESVFARGTIRNTKEDAGKLLNKIRAAAQGSSVVVGLEATNTYHLCLLYFLQQNGLNVVVINPLKTSAYNKIDDYGNKTDPIDAKGICQFLLDMKHKNIKQINQKHLVLRELCRCLQKLQQDLTRTISRVRTRLAVVNPEFVQYFKDAFCESALWIADSYLLPEKIAEVDVEELQQKLDAIAKGFGSKNNAQEIVALAKNSFCIKENVEGYVRYIRYHLEELKFLKQKVREIKREIRKEAKKEYCREEVELSASIPGVSVELAAGILGETGGFDNFEKRSSLVKFAGMVVLQNQSGNTIGKSRMSKQGSPYLRAYLHQAAMGVTLHSATFGAVYANRNLRANNLDRESKRIAKAKTRSNVARRVLETMYVGHKKKRKFNDKIAFDSLQLDDFVRETIATQFSKQLSNYAKE